MLKATSFSPNNNWRDGLNSIAPFVLLGLLASLAALPILALVWIAAAVTTDVWVHLLNFVLPRTIGDTFGLLFMVAIGTTIIGAGCAWLTTMCTFPGKRFFAWAMVLPLAVPTYISAYTHVEFFDYSGPVQTAIRQLAGFETSKDYWFPDIRSVGGAGFIFSVVLYPYVYLTSRLVFSMQGASALEVARSLGSKPFAIFWQIALPMARPAVVAGVALALMETLNDIGAVEALGVKTLTFAVFETWLNRDSLAGAVQLALFTLVLIAVLVFIERRARGNRIYAASSRERPPSPVLMSPAKQALCFAACCLPLLAGLGVPVWILGTYMLRRLDSLFDPQMWSAATSSVFLSVSSAALATLIAYFFLQYSRLHPRKRLEPIARLLSMGYAIPGTVLAVGLLIPLAGFDNLLDGWMRTTFGISTGLFFSGSILIVIYACTLRFLAIAYASIESGFSRISTNIDFAAQALGRKSWSIAVDIHRPILNRALLGAFLLVFVDTMKELSATLLLRPFDFETLAIYVYDQASQSTLENAALASLVIICIGMIPMFFMTKIATPQDIGGQKKSRTLLPATKAS